MLLNQAKLLHTYIEKKYIIALKFSTRVMFVLRSKMNIVTEGIIILHTHYRKHFL